MLIIFFVLVAVGVGYWVYTKFFPKQVEITKKECKPTGCSSQVCADEDVITTCEYRLEYACYKSAKCERQADGKCGWSETLELVECLDKAR